MKWDGVPVSPSTYHLAMRALATAGHADSVRHSPHHHRWTHIYLETRHPILILGRRPRAGPYTAPKESPDWPAPLPLPLPLPPLCAALSQVVDLLDDLLSSLSHAPRPSSKPSRAFDDVLLGYDLALQACGHTGHWDTALRLRGEREEVARQAGLGEAGSVGLEHVLRAMGTAGQVTPTHFRSDLMEKGAIAHESERAVGSVPA